MLKLSHFDSDLEVMVRTNRPTALLAIDAIGETDSEKGSQMIVLECDGPNLG